MRIRIMDHIHVNPSVENVVHDGRGVVAQRAVVDTQLARGRRGASPKHLHHRYASSASGHKEIAFKLPDSAGVIIVNAHLGARLRGATRFKWLIRVVHLEIMDAIGQ